MSDKLADDALNAIDSTDADGGRNVLLIGGGGREHALAWAMARSPRLRRLYCAPGNAGSAELATCVDLDAADHEAVLAFCRAERIDLVVIGPEAPLVGGLADHLEADGHLVFGPSRAAAQLEASKGFTKDLCARHGIPTAPYVRFADRSPALTHIDRHFADAPQTAIVIKADGLAAGKGVVIAETREQARAAVTDCFDGAFGEAGAEVVIEGFLKGEEASLFVLCDGETVLALATAQDHKRALDGDNGPNTGGMGAYSPASVMSEERIAAALERIVHPTLRALAEMGTPYRGVLYAGLMIGGEGPQLIEYNVRFGDPECQVLMARLESDALELLEATASGRLGDIAVRWSRQVAVTVVIAAEGYPGSYEKGEAIRGLERAGQLPGVTVFHAGTKLDDSGAVRSNGGRVLNVTALGDSVGEARARVYEAIDLIDWPGGFFRRDIAWRAPDSFGRAPDSFGRAPDSLGRAPDILGD